MTMTELIERIRDAHLGLSLLVEKPRMPNEVFVLETEVGELLTELERMKLMGEGVVSG